MRPHFALTALALAIAMASPADAQDRSPVAIVGIEDQNLLRALQSVLAPRDPPQTAFQAERLSTEAAERAELFLRSFGYYQAVVAADPNDEPVEARVQVTPGPLFVFSAPALVYEAEVPEAEGRAAAEGALAALHAGSPALSAAVLETESAVLTALKDAGYADAVLARREAVVDHATRTMQVTYVVQAGARARLGAVRLADDATLSPEVAARFAAWERGEVYSPAALARVREEITAAGAFTRVRVSLAEAGVDGAPRDVVLELEPDARRSVEVGLSWSSSEGAGAEVAWTRRNMWRRAESVTLGVTVAEQRQALEATARVPHLAGAAQTGLLSASLAREDKGPYNRDALEASLTFEAPRAGAWRPSYGASVSAELYSETAGIQNAFVLSAFGEARLDRTDSTLDARHGYEVRVRLEPAASFGEASTGFARVTGDARGFYTPEHRTWLTLAARTRVGWIEPIAGSSNDLPTDRLFYAGGGGSVRGYAFNSIYPQARQRAGLNPGGRGLFEGAVEARTRFGERFGLVGFVDAGTAFDDPGNIDRLQVGAGLGVRYDLGFAPLRLDVAAPLNPRDTDDPVAVYLSVGQAF